MDSSQVNIRCFIVRVFAAVLGVWLAFMPQIANSCTVLMIMDDLGTIPAPMAEEEEVKHACSISWSTLYQPTDDHLIQGHGVPSVADPYSEVEHHEVDVPPPK